MTRRLIESLLAITTMTVSLTHLGEVAITGMANEMGDRFLDLCGLADYADLASTRGWFRNMAGKTDSIRSCPSY